MIPGTVPTNMDIADRMQLFLGSFDYGIVAIKGVVK